MKATDGSLRIGESGRKWPDWGKKITQGNISALPEIADVLVAQNSRMGPGKQVTLARKIMAEPASLMEINLGRRQIDGFAAMGFEIGALAIDSFGAGGRRDLIVPADEACERILELLRTKD